MFGDKNAREILSKAGLQPLELVGTLAAPMVPSFQSDFPVSDDEARALLVEARTKDPNYVPPSEQRRHFFRSPKAKRTALDDKTWTFNKHEVATALDGLLSQRPLSHPGVVQALISHAGDTTLEELWQHLYDPDLEKRMKKGEKFNPLAGRNMTWLYTVVSADRLDYISLLCSRGPGQRALDQAFTIALSKNAYEALKLLLGYGAIAYYSKDIIREKICNEDIALVRLLLSAPSSMNTSTWNYCIEPVIRGQSAGRRSQELLLLVLPHYPFPDSVDLLYEALKSEDIIRVSILLAYGNIEDNSAAVNSHAFQIVTQIRDHARRYKFLDLLLEAKMHSYNEILRKELFEAVQRRQDDLVKLLVKFGVVINIEPHDSLHWAVSNMDFETLEVLKHGDFEPPTAYLWDVAPKSASETDLVRLAKILNDLGGEGEPLDRQLLHATKRKHVILAHCLMQYGASVEFQDAAAIKTALDSADLDMLEILLQGPCSRKVLSATVPHAMTITPRGPRLKAIKALVRKGVEEKALDVALQIVAREGQGFDSELMNMLLACGASVDDGSESGNTIAIAVQMRDMAMLRVLCGAGPSMETICNALVTVSETFSTMQPSMALESLELLLRHGATGESLNQALEEVTQRDIHIDVLRLLLAHGADANYQGGSSFKTVIKRDNLGLLGELCAKCRLTSSSLANVLPVVLSPEYYTSRAIEMLLQSSEEPSAALNVTFSINTLKNHPHATEIVRYLLQYGLDVNIDNGSLLSLAITLQDLDLLACILAAKPSNTTLRFIFRDAIRIHDSDYKYKVLSQLLDAASSASIGQDDLLILGTEAALTCDPSLLELALQHGATVGGNSICMAVTALNLPVLNRLLSRRISPEILRQPFELAQSLDCRESDRFNIFESLLKAGHQSTAVNNALIEAVERNPTSLDIPTLLVRHKADINYEGGRVVLIAASTGNLELLELLLPCGPKQTTIDSAFMAALSSDQEPSTKRRVLERLLPIGVSSQLKSEALIASLEKPLASANIPQLLLEHDASVAFNEACVFQSAFTVAPRQLVELLSQYIADGTTATLAFQHAIGMDVEPAKRYWIYECLLSRSVDSAEISKALVNSLETDPFLPDIPRLLLRHGASVTWSDAQPLKLAIASGAVEVTKLLSGHISNPVTADFAFACARKSGLDAEARYNIFHCLLSQNVSTSQLSDALVEATSRGQGDLGIIRLLLENGADPCTDNCRCFALAAHEGFDSIFRLLSEHATVDTVFPTLLGALQDEGDILKWYRTCLNVLGFTTQISNQDLLFQVIRKFPRGTKLLGFILDRGVSTSTTTLYPIHPTWDPEPCTPLLWCLFQRSFNVSNEVIMMLLEWSGKDVLRYHTPQSGLSAVFGCLFDGYRIPVLKAIINSPLYINKSTKELSSQHFFDLVRLQGEEPRIPNSITSISPTLATILLDNFDAFSALKDFGERDDGSLHLAALLAQPKFIQSLIESGHDVNFPSEQYDFLIPLAVICREIGVKRPISGGDWHTRIRDTMRILAPLTDSSWRLGGKSILYYAIHSGFEITKALVDALQVYKDPEKNEKYLFLDSATEIYYSPTMYIELLLRTTEEEKLKLITCLNGHGLEMRYFRDTAPEIGDQPAGYRGLPPHLKSLWREHEENKKREAGRRRQEEEEEAREAVREDKRMEQEFARREKRRAREIAWDQSEFARKQALQEAESRLKMRQVEEDARVDGSRRKARMRLDQEEMHARMEQEQRIAEQAMAQMKARNRLEIEHMENKTQLAMNRQQYLLQTQQAYALALSPRVNGMKQIEGPTSIGRRDAFVEEVD